jgi:TolA-binding protein
MKTPKAISIIGLIAAAMLLFPGFHNCFAETFLELRPGHSTKAEADKKLGPPIKEVIKGTQYDYQPQLDASRLSVTFHRGTNVIKSIDIYSGEPYTKGEYQEWLQLGTQAKTSRDKDGHLVEHYLQKGVALHFAGQDDTSVVAYISHYDVTRARPTPPLKGPKDAHYYDQEADQAIKAKDWRQAKQLIEEGLRRYPNSDDLWHTRAKYYLKTKSEPREVRSSEVMRSMFRAYKLNPSGKHAAEMGWFHKDLNNDCTLALSYFKEAEAKGYATEEPSLLYWMGMCYEDLGMYNSARSSYRRFLNMAPGHEKHPEAERGLDRLRSRY